MTQPIHRAAAAGDVAALTRLLDAGAGLEARTAGFDAERTPLMEAAKGGHLAAVELLVGRGADLDACDEDRATALLLATVYRHPEVVRGLLAAGASLGASGQHPLRWAVSKGDAAMVAILLPHEADVELPDGRGNTLLMVAAHNGDAATAELLLARGADPGRRSPGGLTSSEIAISAGHPALAPRLVGRSPGGSPAGAAGTREPGASPPGPGVARAVPEALLDLLAEDVFRDGVADPREREVLVRAIALLGVAKDRAQASIDRARKRHASGELGAARPLDRVGAYRRCLELALADGEIDEDEESSLRELGRILGIDEGSARQLLAAVRAGRSG